LLISFRSARPDDFEFLARLYFAGMVETIRPLRLDMAVLAATLRERWDPAEVRVITCAGTDIGWLRTAVEGDVLFVRQFYFDSALQGRGIGSKMLRCVIAEAARAGRQ